jgi:hypothetical protein
LSALFNKAGRTSRGKAGFLAITSFFMALKRKPLRWCKESRITMILKK